MERIELANVEDTIKREKLFVKAAAKHLETLSFTRVEEGHEGVLMRSQKEIDFCEKHEQQQIDRMTTKHAENRLRKASRKISDESSDLGPEEFVGPMMTREENRRKNKKKYKEGVTRSKRKREVQSKQKRHRR